MSQKAQLKKPVTCSVLSRAACTVIWNVSRSSSKCEVLKVADGGEKSIPQRAKNTWVTSEKGKYCTLKGSDQMQATQCYIFTAIWSEACFPRIASEDPAACLFKNTLVTPIDRRSFYKPFRARRRPGLSPAWSLC